MDFSRRNLLQFGLLQAGASLVTLPTPTEARIVRRKGPSILQGATDDSRTQFSVVHSTQDRFDFVVQNSRGHTWLPDRVEVLTSAGQPTKISKVYFSGLSTGETFYLLLQNNGVVSEKREFKLLNTRSDRLKFAICSCMDEERHSPEIWRDLVAQQPDFILFVGDSAYCDSGGGNDEGAARLWRRFSEARATLEIYFSQRLIPVLATWDDHDFGSNDSGREFPYVNESQRNFLSFFALDPGHCSALSRGPGVSSSLILGQQQFLLMDDRSWRAAKGSNERYAHWGKEQEEWMFGQMAAHKGLNWLINGTQIFPQMVFKQSMSGDHAVQFEAFKNGVKRAAYKVAMISGDVHFSEVSKIESAVFGYTTYELTSSSIHSYKLPGLPGVIPNDRRVASTGEHNYLLVTSQQNGAGFRLKVESRSPKNRINFVVEGSI
jgi:phosphodiesterase/alkaline phosphatase D-like protein